MELKVKEAVQTILNELNGGNQRKIAETICETVLSDHRTLQECFWSAMLQAQIKFGDLTMDAQERGGWGYDARNEAAVKLAVKIKEIAIQNNFDHGLPYI